MALYFPHFRLDRFLVGFEYIAFLFHDQAQNWLEDKPVCPRVVRSCRKADAGFLAHQLRFRYGPLKLECLDYIVYSFAQSFGT